MKASIKLALLALGAASLSGMTLPAMAGGEAPQGGTSGTNVSNCHSGIVKQGGCLTKQRDDKAEQSKVIETRTLPSGVQIQTAKQDGVIRASTHYNNSGATTYYFDAHGNSTGYATGGLSPSRAFATTNGNGGSGGNGGGSHVSRGAR
jgi:hypothetical protein